MNRIALLLAVFLGLSSCAKRVERPDPRSVRSDARVAIEVNQKTLTAPKLHEEVVGELRERIVETGAGTPVTNPANADLVVRVDIIRTNFTNATEWQWSIVERSSGAVLRTKSEKHGWGATAPTIADQVTGELAALDYSRSGETRVADAEVRSEPATDDSGEAWAMPASSTEGSNAWAVIVGVEDYREELPPATGARRDAEAFAELVQETLNVPEANIKLLLGERASRADLSGALFEWLPRNAVRDGGRVYVFFSGHGAPDVETGDAYLLPYDANPTYIKTGGVPVSKVTDALASLEGQEAYVFLDACFSGSGHRSVLPEGTRPVVPVKSVDSSGKVVLFSAAGSDETTGSHASGAHGLFSYHVLSGLVGEADTNDDANVTTNELRRHVRDRVTVEARRQNRDQVPQTSVPDSVDGDAPLVRGLEPGS